VTVDNEAELTFATIAEGTLEYGNARYSFEAAGPEGSTVTFTVTDNTGTYTLENDGLWGPVEGFELPLQYEEVTDCTLNFSEIGEYTVTFRCFQIGTALLIAEHSFPVTIVEPPLYGDANRDGAVDLLDLVFVRNRLFAADLDEGDNRQADINGDGQVDLADLIEVRNNLGAE